jgi:hypothetical protein
MMLGGELHLRHVGDDDLRPRAPEIRARIEPVQEVLRHVEFLCELCERARVGKAGEPGHRFQLQRDRLRERSGELSVGYRIGLQDRRSIMGREHAPRGGVQLSCDCKPVGLLKRADGVAEVVAV